MARMKKSSLVTPRVDLLEIDRFAPLEPGGEWETAEELLVSASRMYAHAAARMTRVWLLYHEERDTLGRLERGENTGPAVPAAFKKTLYEVGRQAAPRIYATAIQWLQQWLSSTIATKASSRNRCKMWTAVLRGAESWPCFTELPIRIYDSYARFTRDDAGYLWLSVPLVKCGDSDKYTVVRMRLRRPRDNDSKSQTEFREIYRQAERIADGQAKLQCSQISRRGRKWFLCLTVDRAVEPVAVRRELTLYLRPGRLAAWRGRFRGRSADLTNQPLDAVATLAYRITSLRERRARIIEAGRRPAPLRPGARRQWNRTCETLNRQIAHSIADVVLKHRVGRVVLMDGGARSALVGAAGGHYPREQFRRFLAQKLTPTGVEVIERASLTSVKRRIAVAGNRLRVDRVRGVAV